MPLPTITHDPLNARFEVETAHVEYSRMEAAILFTHTEVPPALAGQGLASALIRAGLDFARSEGLGVVPLCPFVAGYMKKHPETQDLLHASYHTLRGE